MSLILSKHASPPDNDAGGTAPTRKERILAWLRTWELYPIVFFAGFLRLYHIDKSLFIGDQANLYRIARDAFTQGGIPITSTPSSVGFMHSPIPAYFYMLPAAFSGDPFWANVATGLFNTAAVLLAYIFTRRYFGRPAAIIVAALYATGAAAIEYSRFIWQPNLVAPLTIIFMFPLFEGVVKRRKGWLVPALLLFGVLGQVHESAYLLIFPLLAAVFLAWKTIRWRDIVFGLLSLVVVYVPYLVWEISINFGDIPALIYSPRNTPPRIDSQALRFYQFLISPFEKNSVVRTDVLPSDPRSILVSSWLRHFRFILSFVHFIMPILLIYGLVVAGIQILWSQFYTKLAGTSMKATFTESSFRRWWAEFMAAPYRQGLVLLLVWQLVPLATMLRHTLPLEPHYLLFFFPGQYILIALFICTLVQIFQRFRPRWRPLVNYGLYGFAGLLIAAQLFGSTTNLLDNIRGNFNDSPMYTYYNDLHSLQHALAEADQIAQQRHIHRIYITGDDSTVLSLGYLAEQMRTPTVVFDTLLQHCLILPGPSAGPALFLEVSYKQRIDDVLNDYTNAMLLDRPQRLNAAWDPFKLYLITPKPEPTPVSGGFTSDLQLLDPHLLKFASGSSSMSQAWVHTRWRLLNAREPAWRTLYEYDFQTRLNGGATNEFKCSFTRMWAGDELLAGFNAPLGASISSASVQVAVSTLVPTTISAGPITLQSFTNREYPWRTLQTTDGKDRITMM